MKHSSGDGHPYKKGYRFWSQAANQFWETGMYTEKAKEYFRNWLNDLQKKEPKYSTLTDEVR